MANPWDNDPIVQPAPAGRPPWEGDPIARAQALDLLEKANTGVNWAGTRLTKAGASVAGGPGDVQQMSTAFGDFIRRNVKEPGTRLRTALGLSPDNMTSNYAPAIPPKAGQVDSGEPTRGGLPTSHDISRYVFGELKVPEVNTPGRVGKVLDLGLETALAGAAFPGGRMAAGFVPAFIGGAGSETAGQLTEGQWYEPLARLLAGGGLGYLTTLPWSRMSTPSSMVRDATEGMTPQQWQEAQARQQDAWSRGVKLTANEAIPPKPDAANPINQLMNDAQASTAGGRVMRPFLTERLEPMKGAIDTAANPVAPPVRDPIAADIALAQAADKAVKQPQLERFQRATGPIEAARNVPIDPAMKAGLLDDVAVKLREVRPGSPEAAKLTELRSAIANSETIGHLDSARKQFKAISKAGAFEGGTKVPDEVRTVVKPIVRDMQAEMRLTSPDYAKGMSRYDPSHPDTQAVKSVAQTSLSPIATTYRNNPDFVSGQFDTIINPKNARPDTVKRDFAALKAQDATAANDALRRYIDNAVDQSFRPLQGGPNAAAGANFAKKYAASGFQRDNLLAAVEGATNKTTAVGFSKLLDHLDRTGQTGAIGSQTQPRQMRAAVASTGPLTPVLEGANVTRGSVVGSLQRKYADLMHGKTYAELAKLTIDPEGVRKLHELALLNPQSAKFQAKANAMLAGFIGIQETIP